MISIHYANKYYIKGVKYMPHELIRKICRRIWPNAFQPSFKERYNLNQIQRFENLLNKNNKSLKNFQSVLEFGCGSGRLVQYMFDLIPEASIYGCDVTLKRVQKCKNNFPKGIFICNGTEPPINYEDNQFDFIYSYSVFTHLSENIHISWLKELGRILKPDGVMIHSVKSYQFVKRANLFSPNNLLKYRLNEPLEDFESKHPYYYVVDNPKRPEYGLTIISRDYVKNKWQGHSGLEIIDYAEGDIEAYPEGSHDLFYYIKVKR